MFDDFDDEFDPKFSDSQDEDEVFDSETDLDKMRSMLLFAKISFKEERHGDDGLSINLKNGVKIIFDEEDNLFGIEKDE